MIDIPNYEGLYAITSCGRVWSYRKKGFLKSSQSSNGYWHVVLSKNNVQETFNLHRLVAENYIPNPEEKDTVNHLDEDKAHNYIQNLVWATMYENNKYGTREARANKEIIAQCGRAIICLETKAIYSSSGEAKRALQVKNASNIRACADGKQKSAYGFHWKWYDEYTDK